MAEEWRLTTTPLPFDIVINTLNKGFLPVRFAAPKIGLDWFP